MKPAMGDIVVRTVIAVVSIIVGAAVGFYVQQQRLLRKKGAALTQAEAILAEAESKGRQRIEEAEKKAEAIAQRLRREAEEEHRREAERSERETAKRRLGAERRERKLEERRTALDRRFEDLEKREKELQAGQSDIDEGRARIQKQEARIEELRVETQRRCEAVSGLSAEQAKRLLIETLEADVRQEAAALVRRVESETKEIAEKKARQIITLAIQRCGADQVTETTVSVVPLPSDDLKGRIIGREGRNIRALEAATGCNVIVDDTPEAVVLSCFDPIRREIARQTLERLLSDGRIHPGRIEELVVKVEKELNDQIRQAGEQTVFELGLTDMHPELSRVVGRLKYRTSYGQNILAHSIEVAHLCGFMAAELGADSHAAKRAGLLHDVGKALTHEVEGTHALIGADLAKKYGEPPGVVHAIAAHHNEVDPRTIIAILVQGADAISSARPGARRETLESYVKRLRQLEEIADGFPGVTKSYALQAGREIRIMVEPTEVSDAEASLLARDISKRIEKDLQYPGQIRVTVCRETRAVEYAK